MLLVRIDQEEPYWAIREVSNEAQKIYDDIRHGHLLIHAHAEDGHTTVAVGSYLSGGKSVYLHGENHLRQVADTFDSPAQAMVAFEKLHGAAMRPGPAPMTDTERAAARARTSLALFTVEGEPARSEPETVPAYAADAGDHGALLDAFLEQRGCVRWGPTSRAKARTLRQFTSCIRSPAYAVPSGRVTGRDVARGSVPGIPVHGRSVAG
ncbi:hypothetical protein ABZY36_34380 [Streptomyces sp. NPDC006627]|uniref:hypothetical protein n=1 Tax=Streptomyces sp. NPDC006627 TaxID=3154679 RepID=UPI0033BB4FD5